MSYEMDDANHMSWMKTYAVPVQSVTTAATATLSATDLGTDHFVYRTSSDAQKYDLPPNPDNMSSYHFMPGAQYIGSHGDLNLAAGQSIGIVCQAPGGQVLAVFQTYVSGATHTFAAWLSAAEWAHASVTGGVRQQLLRRCPNGSSCSRRRGWRKPPDAVVVARPSRWGNPFVVGRTVAGHQVRDRAHAVALFRAMMADSPERCAAARVELAGRDLACWCPLVGPDGRPGPCHADVLLEIANSPRWP